MTIKSFSSAKTHQSGQTPKTAAPSAPNPTASTALDSESQVSPDQTAHQVEIGDGLATVASPVGPPSRVVSPEGIEARPDPAKWAAALAVCAVQATFGLRPPVQLHRWVEPALFEAIRIKADTAARINLGRRVTFRRPHLRRTEVSEPAPGKIEATVIIAFANQIRAVAVRLEWQQHCWQATNINLI